MSLWYDRAAPLWFYCQLDEMSLSSFKSAISTSMLLLWLQLLKDYVFKSWNVVWFTGSWSIWGLFITPLSIVDNIMFFACAEHLAGLISYRVTQLTYRAQWQFLWPAGYPTPLKELDYFHDDHPHQMLALRGWRIQLEFRPDPAHNTCWSLTAIHSSLASHQFRHCICFSLSDGTIWKIRSLLGTYSFQTAYDFKVS